jgi:hypothetical protein
MGGRDAAMAALFSMARSGAALQSVRRALRW